MDLNIRNKLSNNLSIDKNLKGENKVKTNAEKVDDKLKKACSDFEAVFLDQMFQQMRKTVPKDGLLGGGFGKDTYESMYYQELTKSMTEKDKGIAEALYRQIKSHDKGYHK